jgi:hypothetical protein
MKNANAFRTAFGFLAIAMLVASIAGAESAESVLGVQAPTTIHLGSVVGPDRSAVTTVAYDATNQVVSAGTSTTDLAGYYGDELVIASGIGENVSAMKFAVYCPSTSAANLTSATETIRLYDLANAGAYIGGFSATLGAIAKGFYSIFTLTGIDGFVTINLPSGDILVTQQLSNVVGATRMGTVLSYANAPLVGTTNNGFYMSNSTNPAGWYVITGQTYSNLQYELETTPAPVPTESKSWSALKNQYE